MLIISGAWILGGAALIICEGEAICDTLFFGAGVVLVVWFWSLVAGDLDDVVRLLGALDSDVSSST